MSTVLIIVIILSVVTLPWGGTKESNAHWDVASYLGAETNGDLAAQAQDPESPVHKQAIALAKDGSVYVGDIKGRRVQKFRMN